MDKLCRLISVSIRLRVGKFHFAFLGRYSGRLLSSCGGARITAQ